MQPTPTDHLHDRGTDALLADLAALPDRDAADAAASKARVRARIEDRIGPSLAAIDSALGRTHCPRCGDPMTEQEPRQAERDTGVTAFAGGMGCDGCGAEVEDEDAAHRARRWGPRIFIPTFVLAFAGLLIPSTPTPINDSLPSSGLHDAGRATNPAPSRDGWRGFLFTT